MVSFKPIKQFRVSKEAAEQLKHSILPGQFKAGDKPFSEWELAEEFQASRIAVREALRTLENAGFIVTRQGGLPSNSGKFLSKWKRPTGKKSPQLNQADSPCLTVVPSKSKGVLLSIHEVYQTCCDWVLPGAVTERFLSIMPIETWKNYKEKKHFNLSPLRGIRVLELCTIILGPAG